MTSLKRCGLRMLWMTAALVACAPALDWRDVRAEGSGARWLFPCRANAQERRVALAGATVELTLQACRADGLTWGWAQADMADPALVGPALIALQAGAAANLGTLPGRVEVRPVPGATPQPGSGRLRLVGKLPDGAPVRMNALFFAHGTRVFQASVLGPAPPEEAVEAYFGSIRFPSEAARACP